MAEAPTQSRHPFGRHGLLIASALAAAAMAIMYDAWADILRLGLAKEELSYVLLAPVVIAWIAWARRSQLGQCRMRGGWTGLLILATAYAVYWYGFLAD